MEKKVVVVAGPTASGKTSLAVKIAERLSSGVISADSRQVYRSMDLGTGKDLFEYGETPYHCIDVANPSELYTLYHYQRDCYKALQSYLSKDTIPVICGGTGLYIEAVLGKYEIANVPEDVPFREEMIQRDKDELISLLKERDITLFEKTDLSSKKRVVRALEIAAFKTHSSVSYSNENAVDTEPLILITDWERDTLIERIDFRLEQRLSEGMIKEVESLFDEGVTRERIDLFGMEYRQIARYIKNECSYDEMVSDLATEIHRLAKRQRTWFRGMERRGFSNIHWIKNADFDEAWNCVKEGGYC